VNLREWALPVYTVLMQLAAGSLLTLWIVRLYAARTLSSAEIARLVKRPTLVILVTILVAMGGAHFHLSRPFLSFLAIRNIGTSWLSREVLFTVFFVSAVGGVTLLQWFAPGHERTQTLLGWFAIVCGAATVFCMSAIYLLPTQPAWNSVATPVSFLATAVLLGAMGMAAMLILDLKFSNARSPDDEAGRALVIQRALPWLALVTTLTVALLVALSLDQILALERGNDLAQVSLQLLLGLYRPLFAARLALLLAGAGWLIGTVWLTGRRRTATADLLTPVYMSCLLALVGEILGRFLFYATHIRLGI
jgi:anaerobic dimethyl sulfoxide reductase subunit C